MQSLLDKLVADLNRREIVSWLPDMKIGRPAYDHIRAALEGGKLTPNQLRNGMHALFRLRDHGEEQEVFDLFVRLSAHPEKKVRTEALQLAIGLLRLRAKYPRRSLAVSSEDHLAFRSAIARGVSPQVKELARVFLPEEDEKTA